VIILPMAQTGSLTHQALVAQAGTRHALEMGERGGMGPSCPRESKLLEPATRWLTTQDPRVETGGVAEALVNGVRLYYEEHGRGAPILCIHGTSSSARVWRRAAVDQLARLGRVIVYDRRGCTRSERPEPYTTSVAEHARDAAALLEALQAVPAVVVGRSYGGETALELALQRPEVVRGLVLLEAAALSLDDEAARWARQLQDEVEAATAHDPSSVAETFLRRVAGDDQWESFPDSLKRMFTDNSPAILAELRGPALERTAAELARMDVPTLLVAAQESPPMFRQVTELMAAAIPRARVVHVPGGHLIDPGESDVLAFVTEILEGPA
jgi:esterase